MEAEQEIAGGSPTYSEVHRLDTLEIKRKIHQIQVKQTRLEREVRQIKEEVNEIKEDIVTGVILICTTIIVI
jgi:hypothetical protein